MTYRLPAETRAELDRLAALALWRDIQHVDALIRSVDNDESPSTEGETDTCDGCGARAITLTCDTCGHPFPAYACWLSRQCDTCKAAARRPQPAANTDPSDDPWRQPLDESEKPR